MLACLHVRLQARERFGCAAHNRKLRQALELGAGFDVFHARANGQLGVFLGVCIELVGAKKQGFWRQGRALGIALYQTVAVARVLPEALKCWLQVAVQHDSGFVAQVVEYGRRFVEKQRQVVLDAGRGHALADVLVDAALGRVALQHFAPAAAKTRARFVVHGELAAGQQAHLGYRVQAALAVRVERAQRIDLVVKQIDPVGHRRTHGEQIDQAATHRVFARADYLAHVGITRQRQLGAQPGFVKLLADLEVKGVARQKRRGRQAVERRGGRHQHHVGTGVAVALADAPERRQALADEVLVG